MVPGIRKYLHANAHDQKLHMNVAYLRILEHRLFWLACQKAVVSTKAHCGHIENYVFFLHNNGLDVTWCKDGERRWTGADEYKKGVTQNVGNYHHASRQ